MKTRIIEALTEKFPGVEASIIERVARGLAKTITTEDQATDADTPSEGAVVHTLRNPSDFI